MKGVKLTLLPEKNCSQKAHLIWVKTTIDKHVEKDEKSNKHLLNNKRFFSTFNSDVIQF